MDPIQLSEDHVISRENGIRGTKMFLLSAFARFGYKPTDRNPITGEKAGPLSPVSSGFRVSSKVPSSPCCCLSLPSPSVFPPVYQEFSSPSFDLQ